MTLSPPLSIAEAFAAAAQRYADHVAVWDGENQQTYGELLHAVQRIVAGLDPAGIAGDRVVAVSGRRGAELYAAILATLWRADVLLTLDPALPAVRQEMMLREARAEVVLTAAGHSLPPLPCGVRVLDVAAMQRTPSVTEFQPVPVKARTPAYVFFTSGTTATPRAVLGVHGGLAHFVDWQSREFGVGHRDRCGQLTGLSFDVVLRDILTPLCSGATLCVPPGGVADVAASRALPWLRTAGITMLHTVPSIAAMWLADAAPEEVLPDMRIVFFAGEPLQASLVEEWRRRFGAAATIVNLYGPTETTLAKCYYVAPGPLASGVLPVGTPMPGARVLVLGEGGHRVKKGQVGEIHIATKHASLGYLNDPAATQRLFVPCEGVDGVAEIRYSTGDLGRLRADGLLEVVGRVDDQVKIHGIRVSLGEVEAHLVAHPAVATSAVLFDAERAALLAFVVPRQGSTVGQADLREHARERLPSALVPRAFHILPALPLTANGKLDRNALRATVLPRSAAPTVESTEQDPVVAAVRRAWCGLLGLDKPHGDRGFVDEGGDSLLAARFAGRVKQEVGAEIGLVEIFDLTYDQLLANVLETMSRGELRTVER